MSYVWIISVCAISFWILFRSAHDRNTRITGSGLILLSGVCFGFYSAGIYGIGLSEWILQFFAERGISG